MRIDQNQLDALRNIVSLPDLIGDYLRLNPEGVNFKGLCPFHKEKTPSFKVNQEKGIYHCFGCGKGGNIFQFIMEIENLGFVDAVKLVAQKTNFPLNLQENTTQENGWEDMEEANKIAVDFYHQYLLGNNGKKVLDYLTKRNINRETLLHFSLGFAPASWDALLQKINPGSRSLEGALQAGVLSKNTEGKLYDRFRQRLIFPIYNLSGKIIAMGGRALAAEQVPKYLNSPENPLYQKGKILYGLYHSRDYIRRKKQAILVEGYMDYLSLYQGGFQNCVAASGTAFTQDQAQLLRRFCGPDGEIIILFDGDEAGKNATLKAIRILLLEGIKVRVCYLAGGEDPDSLIKEKGKETLNIQLESSLDFVSYLLKIYPLTLEATPEDRTKLIGLVGDYCSLIKDNVLRNEYLRWSAKKLGVSESLLLGTNRKFPNKFHNEKPNYPHPKFEPTGLSRKDKSLLQQVLNGPPPSLDFKQTLQEYLKETGNNSPFNQVLSAWQDNQEAKGSIMDQLPQSLQGIVASFQMGEDFLNSGLNDENFLIKKFQEMTIKSKIIKIKYSISRNNQDPKLLEKYQALKNKLTKLE